MEESNDRPDEVSSIIREKLYSSIELLVEHYGSSEQTEESVIALVKDAFAKVRRVTTGIDVNP